MVKIKIKNKIMKKAFHNIRFQVSIYASSHSNRPIRPALQLHGAAIRWTLYFISLEANIGH